LRTEYLLDLAISGAQGASPRDSHTALAALVDLTDLLGRMDLRSDITKEINRQITRLRGLMENPNVDKARLEEILADLGDTVQDMRGIDFQPGRALRNDELVISVRQRLTLPAALCNFDAPAYHHWLNRPADIRQDRLQGWLADLMPLRDAVEKTLTIIRDSAGLRPETANDGLFAQTLDGKGGIQMVRVGMPAAETCYPEVSGDKHRITVRFLEQTSPNEKPSQCLRDIPFEVAFCGL
jgi:cell division protein ZapD